MDSERQPPGRRGEENALCYCGAPLERFRDGATDGCCDRPHEDQEDRKDGHVRADGLRSFSVPEGALEALHTIDPGTGEKVGVTGQVMSPENRGLFLVTSLIEEAITSSQLESAVTTRKVAAAMIRTGRKPWGVSGEYGDVVHTPPIATELTKRMAQMCDFANSQTLEFFVHPVVRGIILHFLLAFDHPFIDGNGRTARALF